MFGGVPLTAKDPDCSGGSLTPSIDPGLSFGLLTRTFDSGPSVASLTLAGDFVLWLYQVAGGSDCLCLSCGSLLRTAMLLGSFSR
jgi:hypothetical protein